MRRLIDEVAFDDVRKSFKHFAVLFPRLAFDTTVTVRSNVIRVLGDYIKKLKKNCEPYLEKVRIFRSDVVIIMLYSNIRSCNASNQNFANYHITNLEFPKIIKVIFIYFYYL